MQLMYESEPEKNKNKQKEQEGKGETTVEDKNKLLGEGVQSGAQTRDIGGGANTEAMQLANPM